MDVDKTSSDDSTEKLYAEIAEKTKAAIQAESPPLEEGKQVPIQPTLPSLPRYEPPAPPRPMPDRREMLCRMFFPTSGHQGFDTLKLSDEYPPLDIVRQMILYETRLRLCDSIQELMDEYHHSEQAVTYVNFVCFFVYYLLSFIYRYIHDIIQQHVVEYFGYHDLNALRTALARFPDDPIVQAAFYGKKIFNFEEFFCLFIS